MNRHELLRQKAARSSQEAGIQGLKHSSEAGLRNVHRSLELTIAALPRSDRGPVACRAGCDFCCHLRVLATAPEVFALLDYLKRTNGEAEFDAFVHRVRELERTLHGLPAERLLTVNLPCPALVQGRCSGYAARPLNCRAYHSLSVGACRESFEHPEDLHRGHPQLASLARAHAGTQAGLRDALEHTGQDSRQYELVTALAEAIDDPAARQRLTAGERVFLRALTLDQG